MKNMSTIDLQSRFYQDVNETCPLSEYPRPQMQRDSYLNLNGIWKCQITKDEKEPSNYNLDILVPFAIPTLLSKVNHVLQVDEFLHYKKEFMVEEEFIKDITILHFGAVDQSCDVYVNDKFVGSHLGGYLPFSFDISDHIIVGSNTIKLRVRDLSNTSFYSYGKQSLKRGGMWYTPTSGIWQTVWLESVNKGYLKQLKITPNIDDSTVNFKLTCDDKFNECKISIYNYSHNLIIEETFNNNDITINLTNFILWKPEDPYLYYVKIEIDDIDIVNTYFAMRKFSIGNSQHGPCFMLNNQPYFIHGLLDQGYISDGGYTFPTDEAMKFDIIEMKKLGFNTLRKHIKIEPLRWYYHCDTLGMIVFQDLVNGGKYDFNFMTLLPTIGFKKFKDNKYKKFGREKLEARTNFINEMHETVNLLYNSPSVASYTIFNEGWGQFDALTIEAEIKKLDPTRVIDHASGWFDQGGGDICSLHVYFRKIKIKKDKRPIMVTEFGGYSYKVPGHVYNINKEYGYKKFKTLDCFANAFIKLYEKQIIPNIEKGLCGCIYTQVSDVEDETNGILTYDRKVNKLENYQFEEISEKLKL